MSLEYRKPAPFDAHRSLRALHRYKRARAKRPHPRPFRPPRKAKDILEALGGIYGAADKAVPSELLIECRRALGCSRAKLARDIGISSTTLGNAERGRTWLRRAPRLLLARHIAALSEAQTGGEQGGGKSSDFWAGMAC